MITLGRAFRNILRSRFRTLLVGVVLALCVAVFVSVLAGVDASEEATAEILADEPTGNLDWETSTSIVNMLGKLATERKRTIVMVTHDPQMATYASRKLFIRDGKLRDDDPVYAEALRQAGRHLPDEPADTEPPEAD